VDFFGACEAINATNSVHGTTKFHLIEEHRLARAPRAQVQAEVLLLHLDIVLHTREVTALVWVVF